MSELTEDSNVTAAVANSDKPLKKKRDTAAIVEDMVESAIDEAAVLVFEGMQWDTQNAKWVLIEGDQNGWRQRKTASRAFADLATKSNSV